MKSLIRLGRSESSLGAHAILLVLSRCGAYLFVDLSQSTAIFAKSCAMLGNAEEHTALSRALSQLAETEEKIEVLQREQSDQDFYTMAELLKDYISLMTAVKVSIGSRNCDKLRQLKGEKQGM